MQLKVSQRSRRPDGRESDQKYHFTGSNDFNFLFAWIIVHCGTVVARPPTLLADKQRARAKLYLSRLFQRATSSTEFSENRNESDVTGSQQTSAPKSFKDHKQLIF